MLYFMKPFSMVPIGRLGHLGCGTVPTSLKLAWHSDPACRGHRPSVRYFGLCTAHCTLHTAHILQGTSVLSPAFPLLISTVADWVIAYKSDEYIFHSQPIVYVLLFGLVAAKITNRLVVSFGRR